MAMEVDPLPGWGQRGLFFVRLERSVEEGFGLQLCVDESTNSCSISAVDADTPAALALKRGLLCLYDVIVVINDKPGEAFDWSAELVPELTVLTLGLRRAPRVPLG
jgi:hypothetical protein